MLSIHGEIFEISAMAVIRITFNGNRVAKGISIIDNEISFPR